MEANELMIDDWVYNKNIDKPMQVYPMMFSQMFRRTPDATTEDYNIFPIPLTPEILEKNGFVIKKKWAQLGNFGDSLLIMWHFEDDAVLGDFKHELEIHQNDTGKVHVHIPCEYVHELQHALKLCGIEKEIEL